MISISLCMIVKNEEDVIGRCLASVCDAVDEIVIVDTGSTDKTVEKVEAFDKARVYHFTWVDDFAKARNYSFSKATKEYTLWLDADDVLLDEDREKLIELKKNLDESADSVVMNYIYGRDKDGVPTVVLKRNRLVKKSRNFKWIGRVHEYIDIHGKIIYSDINVSHYREKTSGDRNLRIFKDMEKNGEKFSSRDLYYYGNELSDHGKYDEAIDIYKKFLNTGGWIEDEKRAYSRIVQCYICKGDSKSALEYMVLSMTKDIPRPDICCSLGRTFMDSGNIAAAVFWYKAALLSAPDEKNQGTWNVDSFTFTPNIQLCVCYDRMGDIKLAEEYNEKAAKYKPQHPSVIQNRKYFMEKNRRT